MNPKWAIYEKETHPWKEQKNPSYTHPHPTIINHYNSRMRKPEHTHSWREHSSRITGTGGTEAFADNDNVIYEICNESNSGTSWESIRAYAEEDLSEAGQWIKDYFNKM